MPASPKRLPTSLKIRVRPKKCHGPAPASMTSRLLPSRVSTGASAAPMPRHRATSTALILRPTLGSFRQPSTPRPAPALSSTCSTSSVTPTALPTSPTTPCGHRPTTMAMFRRLPGPSSTTSPKQVQPTRGTSILPRPLACPKPCSTRRRYISPIATSAPAKGLRPGNLRNSPSRRVLLPSTTIRSLALPPKRLPSASSSRRPIPTPPIA